MPESKIKDTIATEMDLCIGIDIGSTTTKIIALIPGDGEIIYSDYQRHNAKQLESIEHPKEREMVAYHEVGHALISALQKNAQPV